MGLLAMTLLRQFPGLHHQLYELKMSDESFTFHFTLSHTDPSFFNCNASPLRVTLNWVLQTARVVGHVKWVMNFALDISTVLSFTPV